jgi:hypothetical protein
MDQRKMDERASWYERGVVIAWASNFLSCRWIQADSGLDHIELRVSCNIERLIKLVCSDSLQASTPKWKARRRKAKPSLILARCPSQLFRAQHVPYVSRGGASHFSLAPVHHRRRWRRC